MIEKIRLAAGFLRDRLPAAPQVGLVLGSGLGGLADRLENPVYIPYSEIPGFVVSTAPGHAGRFVAGQLAGKQVLCMQGRLHFYEGHSMEDIAKYADKVLVMDQRRIAMYDTVEHVFARADELLELGLSVPQVTKVFLRLRAMGLDLPQDVYTVPYAVKMILEAKQRRDAGESLVLPREQSRKGGVSEC